MKIRSITGVGISGYEFKTNLMNMAKYKPGQLFTYKGKIYRVMKTDKKDYCNEACAKNNEYNNILCIHDFLGIPTLITTLQCQKWTGKNYPKYIKDNPLCVNKLKTES